METLRKLGNLGREKDPAQCPAPQGDSKAERGSTKPPAWVLVRWMWVPVLYPPFTGLE